MRSSFPRLCRHREMQGWTNKIRARFESSDCQCGALRLRSSIVETASQLLAAALRSHFALAPHTRATVAGQASVLEPGLYLSDGRDGILVGDCDGEAGSDSLCRWPAPADDVQLLGARGQTRRWRPFFLPPSCAGSWPSRAGSEEQAKVFATRCVKLAYLC